MKALYKLQAKAWISNMFNKMDFIMTFLFLAVLGSFISFGVDTSDANGVTQVSKLNVTMISSIVLLMVAQSAIMTFGVSFFEMKDSVLLKRIGATEITKLEAVVSFVLWGMTSMVILIGWMALLIGICQIPGFAELTGYVLYVTPETWTGANWAGVIVAIIITMVSFYAIAFFFVSISKDATAYQMSATFYFFLISFLGGAYTPNADIEWMKVISFLSPLGWGRELMSASMSGADVFSWSGGYDVSSTLDIYTTLGVNMTYGELVDMVANTTWEQAIAQYNSNPALADITIDPSMDATQVIGNAIAETKLAIFKPTHIGTWQAIGEVGLPIIYGLSAGAAATKFFKWD